MSRRQTGEVATQSCAQEEHLVHSVLTDDRKLGVKERRTRIGDGIVAVREAGENSRFGGRKTDPVALRNCLPPPRHQDAHFRLCIHHHERLASYTRCYIHGSDKHRGSQ